MHIQRDEARRCAKNLKEALESLALTTVDVVDALLVEFKRLEDEAERVEQENTDLAARADNLVEALRYCARPGAADSGTASKALKQWEEDEQKATGYMMIDRPEEK